MLTTCIKDVFNIIFISNIFNIVILCCELFKKKINYNFFVMTKVQISSKSKNKL